MLPTPENYQDWRQWAQAVNRVLSQSGFDPLLPQALGQGVPGGGGSGGGGGGDATSVSYPAGYKPLWLSSADANIYLGNTALSPPTAPDKFQIDNLNLLNAVINTAKLADDAVTAAKILNATIGTAEIANAAIVSALIGDLQVIQAKIADLAVNNAKIANAAIDSAKIANLAVGAAQIALLAVGNAQIANAAIDSAKIQDASIATADIGLAQITQALIANLAVGSAQIIDANILTAKIADAAIIAAKILDGTITTAKIGDAQITNAKIADATISSAKIASLVVDKIAGGTLGVDIDVGAGMLNFSIGGNKLMIGRGFGTSNQFFLWFGPDSYTKATATEAAAIVYFKTNGDAYFGGSLSAGVLKNGATSTTLSQTATVETGTFSSNGDPRVYTASIYYTETATVLSSGSFANNPQVTLNIEKWNGSSWVLLASQTVVGTKTPGTLAFGENATYTISGSFQFTDTSGGLSVLNLRTRLSGWNDGNFSGSVGSGTQEQRTTILSTEE